MNKKILVFAYNEVGHACLNHLIKRGEQIVAVYTHHDNPKENIWFPSVAALAQQHQIPVHFSDNPNTEIEIERIKDYQADIIFAFYYRHLLCNDILYAAPLGAFNMHGSLLPKYRGRAPINWAIINGETQTGATLHHMVKKADAGDIVDQQAVGIETSDTAQLVFRKVCAAAVEVLERQIDAIKSASAPRTPQDDSQVTIFHRRTPEDGRIDWHQSANNIYNLIRAVTKPYPGAFSDFPEGRLLIWWANVVEGQQQPPGTILSKQPLCIQCGKNALEVIEFEWINQLEQKQEENLCH